MIVKPTVFSAMVGGGSLPSSFDFNDAASDLNSQHSINKIEFSTGWVVDGMRVTYGTEQGLERQIVHGTFRSSGNKLVTIGTDEFISKVEGQHGRPNGQYDYGDCIQKIRFRITNSKTKEERYTEYFGAAEQGQNLQSFSWEGHMFAFAGRADNSLSQVGLKGLRFGALSGDKVTLALSVPYGGDRTPQIAAKPYNDIVQFGAALDFKKPIKSIAVWSGQVVDGLEITYNLSDGTTLTAMHGAQGGGKTVVDIAPTERIVEINGIWGLSSPSTNWGVQMQLLRFTIFDSVTQFYRTTNAFGMPSAKDFVQETRKDICVRGPFVGVSGTADNNLKQVGLDTTVFYTQCPTI